MKELYHSRGKEAIIAARKNRQGFSPRLDFDRHFALSLDCISDLPSEHDITLIIFRSKKGMQRIFLIVLYTCTITAGVFVHETMAARADIGIDEKLGQFLPADATFVDENGHRVNLRSMIDKPTIIAPVYLSCMHVCPMLLNGVADVLGKLELIKPGKDFQVLALSFDDKDTPAIAREKKPNYLKAIGRPFPEDSWKFLTGNEASIQKFTASIGFRFQRDGHHGFSHPVTLVVIAPGGKIVRYVEGVSFLPFEVTMAVTEASQGKVGSAARKVLMYCFSYDPLEKTYVFNILKVTGTVMLLFVGSFLIYLLKTTRKQKGS
jgi:protein SCO1/2